MYRHHHITTHTYVHLQTSSYHYTYTYTDIIYVQTSPYRHHIHVQTSPYRSPYHYNIYIHLQTSPYRHHIHVQTLPYTQITLSLSIYVHKEELKTVVCGLLTCTQPNRPEIFTALWNPYRRVSSRGRRGQIRFSRGAHDEKTENYRLPFWFYGLLFSTTPQQHNTVHNFIDNSVVGMSLTVRIAVEACRRRAASASNIYIHVQTSPYRSHHTDITIQISPYRRHHTDITIQISPYRH